MSKEQRPLPIVGQMFDRSPQALSTMRERARARAVPMHAQVYLENKCNLKCQHCYESEETHPTGEHLSLAELETTFTELAALGCLQLTLTGGEIFLRRDLMDILALVRRLRFQTTLFTSGYFIDAARAAQLKALAVGQVDISVYSDVEEDHDAFTQIKGSWQRSINALRFLTEAGVKATLKCVLTTFNVDRIDRVIALAQSVGVDFQFDPNVRPRMSNDTSTMRFALSPEVLRDKVYARRDLYPAFQQVSPDTICRGQDFLHGTSAMCGAGSSTMAIGARGEVYPCGFFPVAVGNLKTHALTEIWERSGALQDMREMTYDKMESCPSCDLRSACHPCMAYAQVENGNYKSCNSASKASAEALLGLAERGARAQAKIARAGPALPLVGDVNLPAVDGSARGVLAMFD